MSFQDILTNCFTCHNEITNIDLLRETHTHQYENPGCINIVQIPKTILIFVLFMPNNFFLSERKRNFHHLFK